MSTEMAAACQSANSLTCSVDELRTLFLFEKLTDDQLQWLCERGHVELLEPGLNGLFVEPRPDSVSGALGQLSADPSGMLEMGRAARRASLRFSWENTVERHLELYRSMAGGRRGTLA